MMEILVMLLVALVTLLSFLFFFNLGYKHERERYRQEMQERIVFPAPPKGPPKVGPPPPPPGGNT